MRKKIQTEQNGMVGQGAIYGPPPNTEPLSAPCQPSCKVPKEQGQKQTTREHKEAEGEQGGGA